jgi:cyclase
VIRIAKEINIPFTVGGGISSVEDVALLLASGADKISVNSAAVKDPSLISTLAARFGSQCIVLAIDTKFENNNWMVYVKGGKERTELTAPEWAKQAAVLGAGEILLTSIGDDGTKKGFANGITRLVAESVNIPVIASGGAGKEEHFEEAFILGKADAALAASVFHYEEIKIPQLKKYLIQKNIPIRP